MGKDWPGLVANAMVRRQHRQTGNYVTSASPQMSSSRKPKKSRQPSKLPASLGIPTHIGLAPIGFGAELDLVTGSEGAFLSRIHRVSNGWLTTVTGANHGRGSRIAFRDSNAGRLPDAPCASTQATEPENDVTGERALPPVDVTGTYVSDSATPTRTRTRGFFKCSGRKC